MYISRSFTTAILLLCSSISITALASDPVAVDLRSPRPNTAAVEPFSVDEKRLGSNKRHDLSLRLSNHIAALVPRAPQEPAPAAPVRATNPKQNGDNNNQNAKDDDEHDGDPDTPDSPDHKKNESGEGGTDDNSHTEGDDKGPPEDGNNSMTRSNCAHHSGTASGSCISTATATRVKAASATYSSFTSSSSTSTSSSHTATITTHSTTQPQLAPASTSAPAPTLSSSTGAAAGIDARNPFARVVGGNGGVVAIVGFYVLWGVLPI